MYRLKHPFIAKLHTHFQEDIEGQQFIYLVLEMANQGTVRDIINKGPVSDQRARDLIFKVSLAV